MRVYARTMAATNEYISENEQLGGLRGGRLGTCLMHSHIQPFRRRARRSLFSHMQIYLAICEDQRRLRYRSLVYFDETCACRGSDKTIDVSTGLELRDCAVFIPRIGRCGNIQIAIESRWPLETRSSQCWTVAPNISNMLPAASPLSEQIPPNEGTSHKPCTS